MSLALAIGCGSSDSHSERVNVTANSQALLSAPALNRAVSTNMADAAAFIYTGTNPIQTGVASGTISLSRIAVLRGSVHDRSGVAISGAQVTVVGHAELGSTVTQADGNFDLAVNGGQIFRLRIVLASYLPVERTVRAPIQDYLVIDDIAMVKPDTVATSINLSGSSSSFQVARGTATTDASGTRRATLLVPPATQASMTVSGSSQPLTSMNVRASEYTVGTSSANAVPATIPGGGGKSYAVELSADEAIAAGATAVEFSNPLPFYVENYLALPVGAAIPHGYYDSGVGSWVPGKCQRA